MNALVVSSIQIKIRFLIGLYEQCMKQENQKARRKTPLIIFKGEILDLYNSIFQKPDFSWLAAVNAYCQKENSPFSTAHGVLKWVLSGKFKLTNDH